MKKKKHRLIIYCTAAVVLLLAIILIVEGINSFHEKTDLSEGKKIIKQAEAGDTKKIETKIQQLEEKDKAAEGSAEDSAETEQNYRELFANSVVMGDSITEGLEEYDILNASSVVAEIGVELVDLGDQVKKVKELNPQFIFLAYGMNDIAATNGDTQLFVKQYTELIDDVQKKLPDTKIFVNSIFPVQEQEIEENALYAHLSEYNDALQQLCDKRQIAYIDNTDLAAPDDYEEDGVHFKATFYPVWLKRMAEVASL